MSKDILDEIKSAAETVASIDQSWWPDNDTRMLMVSKAIKTNAEDIAKRYGEKEEKISDFIKQEFWRI